MSECATYAVLDAGLWPQYADERACGRRLLRSVGPGSLLLWDRGLHSFEMVKATLARGSHLLGRLPATVKPKVMYTLADGSQLISLRPAEKKSHQRPPQQPLRVVQEVYGLLVTHYIITHNYIVRAVMVEAGLAPSRLSFTATLRIIREMVPEMQRTAAAERPRLYWQLLADVAARPLPARVNRINPRVVKRKMSNFGVEGLHHRHWPQPTKSFREAVVLLN